MIQFTNPEFTVKVGRFDAIVRTSYMDGDRDFTPTAFATVQGDEQNFICTSGDVSAIFENPAGPDKGAVLGYRVVEKFSADPVYAYHTDFVLAIATFGAEVAKGLLR